MRALVTGAAGFIGSTLSERLVDDGWDIAGVDSFDPYYDVALKRANVAALTDRREFELIEGDLLDLDLPQVMAGVDVVFHQAAQPGVRLSWASRFDTYVRANVLATQRLLEAARLTEPSAVVYASSSSVYGRIAAERTTEDDPLVPFSPYGVTKLAGEHLCTAYGQNFGVPTVALRYFTVYGPRQRPDMALHRLVRAAADGTAFPLFGDGEQVRDFTFVDDVVEANLRAARARCQPGTSINVAGGSSARLIELVELVGEVVGREVEIEWRDAQPGDVPRTGGSSARARELLGWSPSVALRDGVARQAAHQLG